VVGEVASSNLVVPTIYFSLFLSYLHAGPFACVEQESRLMQLQSFDRHIAGVEYQPYVKSGLLCPTSMMYPSGSRI
jgi:hypothetical protein